MPDDDRRICDILLWKWIARRSQGLGGRSVAPLTSAAPARCPREFVTPAGVCFLCPFGLGGCAPGNQSCWRFVLCAAVGRVGAASWLVYWTARATAGRARGRIIGAPVACRRADLLISTAAATVGGARCRRYTQWLPGPAAMSRPHASETGHLADRPPDN